MRKRLRNISLAMLVLAMAGSAVCAEEAASAAEAAQENGAELSQDWKDYQISIDGRILSFPMMYGEFEALGDWTPLDEIEGAELEPGQYDMFRFSWRDTEAEAYIYILNLGVNTQEAKDCIVGGLSFDAFDWDPSIGRIELAKGIVRGEADRAAVEAAYGAPSDVYEGEYSARLTYETDYYSYVELSLDAESGLLTEVDIRNFVEPDGFDAGEVSDAVPAAVAEYVKPEELGDDPAALRIEVDGQVYALPVPVSTLIADGWEINAEDSDPSVAAASYGWVTLLNGGQELRTSVENPESNAVTIENSWITEISLGVYDTDLPGALPGGIAVGMQEADFLKVLEDAGISSEKDESGDFTYYSFADESWDRGCEVTVYTGEDGPVDQNAVMAISCSNTCEEE